MDAESGQISAHPDRSGEDAEALLAHLQSGLDGLRSLLAEIDAREQQLGLELHSILSRFAKHEQQQGGQTAA